jgi:nitroimidazol reductase NimA-like FMN-containing flavoprotein (pyridoxamine 5'-phosphate oxidase superfamily)
MRRKDREVTEPEKIDEIIRSCDCCRVGLADEGAVYIVPLSFGYSAADGLRVFYFHGAAEGRKMDLIRKNPDVGFELDTGHGLTLSEKGCGCSFRFQSVIGRGKAALVEDPEERLTALRILMEQYGGKKDWTFDEHVLCRTAVWKLTVEEISCKQHE